MPDPTADVLDLVEHLGITSPSSEPIDSPETSDPAGATGAGGQLPGSGPTGGGRLDDEPEASRDTEVKTAVLALTVPGMVFMGLTWLGVRRLVLRSGAGAVVLATRARPPRPGDVQERQLVNLVEELALAAGVPPPRVMLVDSYLLNAAVVGRSIDDATPLFPRRMLDDLHRGPTAALVADLLAVVVNGDLRIALVIASVFQTVDLVGAALTAPFSRHTRHVLWRLCRLAVRRRSRRDDGAEAHFVAEDLVVAAQWDEPDKTKGGCWTVALQFPFVIASTAYTVTRLVVGPFLVTPLMAALWRRRRLRADATAVELTRDPASLAQAFDYLEKHGNTIAAGSWMHLFVVGPEVEQERARRRWIQHRGEISRDRTNAGEYPRDVGPSNHDLDGFLPPLGRRRERLAAMAMGEVAHVEVAHVEVAHVQVAHVTAPRPVAQELGLGLLMLVVALLVPLVTGMFMCVALLFQVILLAPPVILVHVLLR